MPNAYDIAWRLALAALAPLSGFLPKLRKKIAKALKEKSAADVPAAAADAGLCVMIHAVSLGEMNATPAMVSQLAAARPDLRFLITATTDVGYVRGLELYGSDRRVTLARYPLDLSPFIERLLDRQKPAVVVLMELEVWPNFVWHCCRRGIPVVLVNGRLTESSYKNYRLAGPLVRRMFRRLSDVCAQDAAYATRFAALGARPESMHVTGTMKFDTAEVAERVAGDAELAADVALRPAQEPIWVCGSTGPGEERIALEVYRQLLGQRPDLRLAIIPRHPQRFDEVAAMIARDGYAVIRRSESRKARSGITPALEGSRSSIPPRPPVILGDTMGELRKFYSLADVVFVGRSLVDLGQRQRGSDMIEPAALGKPVILGLWTHNFADAVRQLKAADAVMEVDSGETLHAAVVRVLEDPAAATAMGGRARDVVRSQQGATARHVQVILGRLPR